MIEKKILSILPSAMCTIRKLSHEMVESSMTLPQLRVLFFIEKGMGQTEMAEVLQVSSAAVSKMIHSLVDKSYATRETLDDRRRVGLKLTREGKKVLTLVSGTLEKTLATNIKKLSSKEYTQLSEGLKVLEKLMGFIHET